MFLYYPFSYTYTLRAHLGARMFSVVKKRIPPFFFRSRTALEQVTHAWLSGGPEVTYHRSFPSANTADTSFVRSSYKIALCLDIAATRTARWSHRCEQSAL